jgi:hypothetical protein
MKRLNGLLLVELFVMLAEQILAVPPPSYIDGRPQAIRRLEVRDQGVVLKHGGGPGDCDIRGAREAIVFEHKGIY